MSHTTKLLMRSALPACRPMARQVIPRRTVATTTSAHSQEPPKAFEIKAINILTVALLLSAGAYFVTPSVWRGGDVESEDLHQHETGEVLRERFKTENSALQQKVRVLEKSSSDLENNELERDTSHLNYLTRRNNDLEKIKDRLVARNNELEMGHSDFVEDLARRRDKLDTNNRQIEEKAYKLVERIRDLEAENNDLINGRKDTDKKHMTAINDLKRQVESLKAKNSQLEAKYNKIRERVSSAFQ